MVDVLEDKRAAIAALCVKHGVARLEVFGSALRDDFRPGESDVDLLVEFAPHEGYALVNSSVRREAPAYLRDVVEACDAIEAVLSGVEFDE